MKILEVQPHCRSGKVLVGGMSRELRKYDYSAECATIPADTNYDQQLPAAEVLEPDTELDVPSLETPAANSGLDYQPFIGIHALNCPLLLR